MCALDLAASGPDVLSRVVAVYNDRLALPVDESLSSSCSAAASASTTQRAWDGGHVIVRLAAVDADA